MRLLNADLPTVYHLAPNAGIWPDPALVRRANLQWEEKKALHGDVAPSMVKEFWHSYLATLSVSAYFAKRTKP
jgi:hypothetical protein